MVVFCLLYRPARVNSILKTRGNECRCYSSWRAASRSACAFWLLSEMPHRKSSAPMASNSEELVNTSSVKVADPNAVEATSLRLHAPESIEHRRRRAAPDESPKAQVGGAACYHARGIEFEQSVQDANCACEGAITRARKRRLSSAPSSEWQLVHATAGAEPCASAAQSFDIGVLLPSNYLRFAQDCASETGVYSLDDNSVSFETVGILATGRIVKMRVDSLQKADLPTRTDVVALAESISRACSECRCSSDAAAEETVARSFLSRIQAFGTLNCPTFESIFDQICAVCFNHQLEDSLRAVFLQALHCICSFKSFQTRFVSGRGQLALISLLHSCRSCLSADLALNCINAITANGSNSSKLACPELIEALLSAVDMHVSAAPKVNALLERWYRLCSLPFCCTSRHIFHTLTLCGVGCN